MRLDCVSFSLLHPCQVDSRTQISSLNTLEEAKGRASALSAARRKQCVVVQSLTEKNAGLLRENIVLRKERADLQGRCRVLGETLRQSTTGLLRAGDLKFLSDVRDANKHFAASGALHPKPIPQTPEPNPLTLNPTP